jgi:hypothetical protein
MTPLQFPIRCEREDWLSTFVELNTLCAGRLLSVGVGDLANKLSLSHVRWPLDLAGFRSRVILENFYHRGRVVRDNYARLPLTSTTVEPARLDIARWASGGII